MESPLEYGLESCIGIWIFQAGQIFLSLEGHQTCIHSKAFMTLCWHQEMSRLNMKPDIILSKKDQDFEATNAPKGGAQDQLHRLSRSD